MYFRQNGEKEVSKQNLEIPIDGLIFECLSKNCTESNR
jgi:hypothetical protein